MTPLIRRGLIAEASERPADSPSVSDIADYGARRRLILFASAGIAAYALAMVATIPASAIVRNAPWRTGVAGTIWNGEVGVAGGSKLEWRWAPLRSLTSLGFAVDWRATGRDTDLGGRAVLYPNSIALDTVSGSADGSLLEAIQPDLPFTCDTTMQIEFPRLRLGGSNQAVEGNLTTDAGTCSPKRGGAASSLQPLMLTAEKIGIESRMRLAPAQQRRRTLMTLRLGENGTLDMTMTPEGAMALPFVGLPPGASIRGEI
jgi:hypothetical protein